ncbi:cation diffusion facilitator family transporter [Altererythrobacter aerius]|uniref:Cation diffusion facilitator family transporter n=1 Tax=Tsuneonella aeria TaxID=1837929 RepID=A0A6I4TFU6_9SPHN|nr:cation diffusion facilitator family transporter [Tsuneonella aeria]MXO76192.1 cation diffusion facilitator family transporter [Tsuneonella aeria]
MSAGHDHGAEGMSDARLVWAVIVNVGLTVAQIVGGIVSGSLALIADALHNFSDAASLGLALFARKIGRRPADKLMTFGYGRAEVVAALINLTTLVIVGFYLLIEAATRYLDPQPIEGWTIVIVAGIALIVDVATAAMVHKGSKDSLNIKAAFLHNVSDALASVGVIVAGTLILLYHLYVADLIMTVLIAAYVLYQGFSLLPKTIKLLMGAVPDDVEFDAIVRALGDIEGVASLHHVHIWSIDEHHRSLEAHLVPSERSLEAFEAVKADARRMLEQRFSIGHATLEACLDVEGADHEPRLPAHPSK